MIREFQDEIMRLKAELMRGDDDDGEVEFCGEAPPEAPVALAPLPPRIEKKVEYVEKIIEKTVEREVIVEQGPSSEELAAVEAKLRQQNEEFKRRAEVKRQEVGAQLNLAEEEKKRLLAEIDNEEVTAMQEQQRRAEMQSKLAHMEEKMVVGKTVMEKAIEQEAELKRQQRRLRKQQEKEEDLRVREEEQRQENMELETKCASQEEQVQKLTAKLQKLWDKYQKGQQEMVDMQQFNQGEREDMLQMIRDLRQTLKLKTLVMDSFIPVKDIQGTQERAVWDAEEDEWMIVPAKIDKDTRPVRPASALGYPRPTSEFARINRAMGDPSPRYMYDSIVMTDLDLPERTTEDYEVHPELGDRIEQSLLLALSPDDDDAAAQDGDGDKGKKSGQKKRPTSVRPGAKPKHEGSAAFPQARGLVSRE
mmetsp:Transcript_13724/g.39041  ORF Transcript_13724/g.39041 Transcript_13724/m.39041 type:complete len:420 (-) Transcript_13724:58-1317(-)